MSNTINLSKLLPGNIKEQIFILFTFTLILFSIITGITYYHTSDNVIKSILEDNAIILSKQISNLTSNYILEQDIYSIDSLIHTIKNNNKNIRYIIVLDEEDNVISSTFHHGIPQGLLKENVIYSNELKTNSYISNEGEIYDIFYPINAGQLGAIRIGLKVYEWKTIFWNIFSKLLLIFTTLILFILLLSRILIKNFLQPLIGLSNAAKQFGKGNFLISLPKQQNNELDPLIKSMTIMAKEIKRKNNKINQLLHQTIEIQEEERLRISRELHDETGQVLASLAMSLGLLLKNITSDEERLFLESIQNETIQAMERIRRIAIDLRPPEFTTLGINVVFNKYISNWSKKNNIKCLYTIQTLSSSKDFQLELNLFRIMQEALTNIIKHAQADNVLLILKEYNNIELKLLICDDGIGIKNSLAKRSYTYKHIGLIGMKERVQYFNGYLRYYSNSNKLKSELLEFQNLFPTIINIQWNTCIKVYIPLSNGVLK